MDFSDENEVDHPHSIQNGGSSPSEDNSSVKVALRIRPSLPREIIEGCKTCTTVAEGHPQVWIGSNNAYTYDYVFDLGSAQNQIFDDVVKQLVDGCLKGYNATVLAYGQTGSGKTYTMGTGFEMDPSPETQGIIPRAVMHLFHEMEKIKSDFPQYKAEFTVQLNFVELYNEEVVDLLSQTSARPISAAGGSRPSSANAPIRIHEDSTGSIYLAGVHTLTTSSANETLKVLRDGALSRTTASTNMNDTSSRSHAIFTMHVIQKRVSTESGEAELETLSAKFHFVDLAGSERLKRTMATGERAKEGISINCGLLALGNVISALGDKAKKASHVPYRDSKLTRLLQDSLGGNSRTVMIACVSPSDRDFVETLNTLKYANRARNIKNRVHINQDKSSQTIARLAKEIADLKAELLDFKQGKRTGGEFSSYSDTHQENILLLTELETLRSRLKSKQESIDKLTGTVASYEAQMEIKLLSDTDCDLTKMVKKYLLEIEDLRTKLYESEQECEKLRMKQRRLNETLSSPRKLFMDTVNTDDALLEAAKQEVENERRKLDKMTNSINKIAEDGDTGIDEPVESESESEDESQEENYEAIALLTSEISIKERLIDQLEQSHQHVEKMKLHYEQKLECLNNRIKATIEERDKVMASPNVKGKRSTQLSADYEKQIHEMQQEVKKWQAAQKQHIKTQRDQSQCEKQISRLKLEVDTLKQTKVKLVNQAKADSAKFRALEQQRLKEINSLKKQSRTKEIKLRSLENERNMKDQVLKRKIEEVNNLKKAQKIHMSRSAQGRVPRKVGSPIKAKAKWTSLEHEIRKAVTVKSTVSSLEKEMLNMINERTEARKRLQTFENYLMKDEVIMEEIESHKVNLQFLDDKIQEIQAQIMDISTSAREYDGADLDDNEVRYMFKKLYETNLNNTYEIDRYERRLDDSEEHMKQLCKEISQLRTLLNHVVAGKGIADGDDVNGDIVIPPLPAEETVILARDSSTSVTSRIRKARRLTSTPQELLGSMDNVSNTNGEFLNPNDVLKNGFGFNRNTRQTQSLRLKPAARARPPLMRQDTYNVGDKKFQVDPMERLHSDSNFNSNKQSDKFDTTFLISSEKSPPTSSLSNNRLTYTSDSNNPSDIANTTNNGKGAGIKRVSYGAKERVMNLTHVAESHTKPVISLCATERRLYSGSKDSTVKEFDLYTGMELATYSGHPSNVQCIQLIEDSNLLISASGSVVTLWDVRTATCTKTLTSSGTAFDKLQPSSDRLLQPGESLIQSVAVLRNYLYTTVDNRIRVWDMRKLQGSLGILAGKHSSNIMCLATAQNLRLGPQNCDVIVSGSKDHYIKLYITEPEQTIETIKPRNTLNPPHYDGIESLLIKDTHLYSGSRDTCIKKWDLASEKMLCTAANAHGNWITGLSKLPSSMNMDCIISSSRDGSVKIWDKDLKEVYKADLAPGISTSVDSICVNSQLLFTAGGVTHNGTVSVWKLDEVSLRSLQSSRRREPYKYYPLSPRVTRKSNKIRYSSHEDLMTRSCGFELPY